MNFRQTKVEKGCKTYFVKQYEIITYNGMAAQEYPKEWDIRKLLAFSFFFFWKDCVSVNQTKKGGF